MSALTGKNHRADTYQAVRVPRDRLVEAAMCLVSDAGVSRVEAAKRFLSNAPRAGIDLNRLWCTIREDGTMGQVCLGVVGTGRTGVLFVAERSPSVAEPPTLAERSSLIRQVCDELSRDDPRTGGPGVRLAQSLLEPGESIAAAALEQAGFTRLGELEYLRWIDTGSPASHDAPDLTGVGIERLVNLSRRVGDARARSMLLQALERSYVDTLDCPELCGLRAPDDVLASHRSVGTFDPRTWWVVTHHGEPAGCLLLSYVPEQDGYELVYVGVGPEVRGRGLGAHLLWLCVQEARDARASRPVSGGITCAVDTRNTPALGLYSGFGFRRFATRTPFIRSLADA